MLEKLKVTVEELTNKITAMGFEATGRVDEDLLGLVMVQVYDKTEHQCTQLADMLDAQVFDSDTPLRSKQVINGTLCVAFSTSDADLLIKSKSRAFAVAMGYADEEIDLILSGVRGQTNDMIAKSLALGLVSSSGYRLLEAKLPLPLSVMLVELIARAYYNNHEGRSTEDDRETITEAVALAMGWFESQKTLTPKAVQ